MEVEGWCSPDARLKSQQGHAGVEIHTFGYLPPLPRIARDAKPGRPHIKIKMLLDVHFLGAVTIL